MSRKKEIRRPESAKEHTDEINWRRRIEQQRTGTVRSILAELMYYRVAIDPLYDPFIELDMGDLVLVTSDPLDYSKDFMAVVTGVAPDLERRIIVVKISTLFDDLKHATDFVFLQDEMPLLLMNREPRERIVPASWLRKISNIDER